MTPQLEAQALAVIGSFVERRSAIRCPMEKEYLLRSRLEPVLRTYDLESFVDLAARLAGVNPGEIGDAVVEAMTTNETSWFRDVHPFAALQTEFLPDLIRQRSDSRSLNVWSAASSTGQELFSVAMMMDTHFPQLTSWDVSLLGTDISAAAVTRARSGWYSSLEVNRGLPATYLAKYMVRDGAGYRVRPDLISRTSFQTMNFVAAWPILPSFDVIMCRNVLIYFDPHVRVDILGKINKALRPGGYLILGSAETLPSEVNGLHRVTAGRTIAYQKECE